MKPHPTNESVLQATSQQVSVPDKRIAIEELLQAFLSGKSAKTLRAYTADLRSFAEYMDVASIEDAARLLIGNGHGQANLTAIRFKDFMMSQRLSPATINRRLSALRSLMMLAKTLGTVDWSLQVPSMKSASFRDTRGVGIDGVKRLLSAARSQRNPAKVARDCAIIRLLFDLALRRSEVAGLNVTDLDLAGSRVMVLGKGRTEREPMTLPDPTRDALQIWMNYRGSDDGALFHNVDRAGKGTRLSDGGLYRMVKWLGKKALVRARPHGIRHSAITSVLDLLNGNLRVAQQFARHKNPMVIGRYDDNRADLGGEAARVLAAELE